MLRRLTDWSYRFGCWLFVLGMAASSPAGTGGSAWPQFRGPDGTATAADGMKLPTTFGPQEHVRWQTALPLGHSSPCIWGDRIFLTAFDPAPKQLATLCLDRRNGSVLWRRIAPAEKLENVHQISNPATATPATDGERVYVYFASFGLLAYDFAGKELWTKPLPVPATRNGTGTSPIVADGLVFLNAEYFPKPYLLALEPHTGNVVWRRERFPMMDGYATPVVWRQQGAAELIVQCPHRVQAYGLKDGAEHWWVSVGSVPCSTPAISPERLFVAAWEPGGEPDDRVPLPSFDELLAKYDKDKDGMISKAEFPRDLDLFRRKEVAHIPGAAVKLIWFFDSLDFNKDGKIGRFEWLAVKALSSRQVENALLAIKPGGQGDVTRTSVAWREKRAIPEVPSPVYYRGHVYMVRDGGIFTCLDAVTGKLVYRERLGGGGAYFASLVAGDGKLYAAGESGVLTVIGAGDKFQVLARNKVGEPMFATPALVDGTIYVRTSARLYAFGE